MVSTSWHRPAWALALLLGLLALFAGLSATAGSPSVATAQGGEGRYSVLVFSRTTGFRHTAAINAGHDALDEMATAQDFDVVHSEDAGDFTSHNLRNYDVVVFLNTDGEGILNGQQQIAFERWTQNGGGAVRIHADANADKAWEWKEDMMGGGLFNNHPPIQEATVEVADATHPATDDLPATFSWTDEWYNFDEDPREDVHVLMTVDESTYEGGEHGPGHPIAWCSEYDGGRNFYTAIGHADGGATPAWSNADYLAHISGALEWAAGEEPGDCGAPRAGIPTEASLNKVTLDDGSANLGGDDTGPDTENPMELAVADDGRVFFIEIGAGALDSFNSAVKMYDPATDETYVVGEIPVHRRNENGLLGIALDPDFATNNFIYLYYSVPGPQNEMGTQHLSRFTFDPEAGEVGQLDMASEVVLLEIPHQRRTCCHSAGSLAFGPDNFLYLTTADDTTPFQTNGFAPIDARECGPGPGSEGCMLSDPEDARHAFDARRTSGNAADLRGKLIRIDPIEGATPEDEPGLGSTYDVDDSNLFTSGDYDHLFPGGTYDPALGRPEIFAMGFRNPFRFTVDSETGWVYLGQVGPDAGNDCFPANGGGCATNPRGPRGYDTINQIREAANMGWPFCLAGQGYYEYDYATQTSGDQYDCENGPTNDSPLNTGIDTLPPVTDPLIWYPYGSSPEFPEIPPAGARAAMGGPVYHFEPDLDSDVKLSEYFDDKLIWGDWTRNLLMVTTLDENGDYVTSEELMPNTEFRHPHDIELGPDGALYVIEWGNNFNFAAQGINPDSGLYRIEQREGGLPALAEADASPRSGAAPLEVQFTGELSDRGAEDPPTYAWDFGDGATSTEVNPTHTYEEPGTYEATLTVTDSAGTTTDTVTINVRTDVPCGPPLSDSFEGDALADRWEVIRRDDERLSVADGALNLVSAPMDIFGGETGLPNIVLQPLPGDGAEPWSMTTEVTWNPTQNFQNAGFMIYGDDDNYIKTGMVWNGGQVADGRSFELIKETSANPVFPGTADTPDGFPETFFLRVVSADGNSIVSEFSADGESWSEIGSTDLTGIESPRIGVYATASTQAGVSQPTASFHSVTIEPDRAECPTECPTDEFDGTELDTGKWSFLHPSTETAPFVEDGNLVFTLSEFSFDADRPGPASILGQQMPLDDWDVVAKISAPGLNEDDTGLSQFTKVGLIVWQENTTDPNKHFISYTHNRNGDDAGATTFFEAGAQNGPEAGDRILGDRVGAAPAEENLAGPFWIRITRTGDEIEGFYSLTDPEVNPNWTSLNAGSATDLNIEEIMPAAEGPIYIGPYGANGSIETTFDYVRFTPEGPGCEDPGDDSTPPETDVQLNGADPVPTYDGPVDVTLSATDPAGPGGGEPETHQVDAEPATWAPDEVDLALGDEIQWNFPASANFNHDVWLIAPDEAPDSAGTEVTDGPVPAGGEPVSATFDEPGSWTYFCKIHSFVSGGAWSGMVGTANVAEGGGGEASGVAATEYSVDGGAPVVSENTAGDDPFVTEFTVSGEGEHVVEYGSVDNAGNEEPAQSVTFEIVEDGENAPPVIDSITADPDEGLAPLEVDFSAAVSDPDGDELTYSWDFDGDGTEDSTEEAPTHMYALPGEYEAELTVSDGELEASDTVTVSVLQDGGGEAELTLDVAPTRAAVKVGKRKTFRARVGNTGDAAATRVRVCASAPARKADVTGRECVRYPSLEAAAKEAARFTVKAKRKGAGKRVTVRFVATAANADRETARATLVIKRKR